MPSPVVTVFEKKKNFRATHDASIPCEYQFMFKHQHPTGILICVLASALPIQLPANVLGKQQEVAATYVGGLEEVSGSLFWLRPTLAVAALWE